MKQRQIKFKRVFQKWDAPDIEFREWGAEWKDGQSYSFTSPSYLHGYRAICDIQFTGLTDKNGKEAFEGDVYKANGHNYVIMFNKGAFVGGKSMDSNAPLGWSTEDEYGDMIKSKFFKTECEVIGNIHQNPELI